jgi:hypothetical protein
MLDYPHVRASDVCPLCKRHTDRGLVACWPCYHTRGLRYGNEEAESLIEQTEASLCKVVERRTEQFKLER